MDQSGLMFATMMLLVFPSISALGKNVLILCCFVVVVIVVVVVVVVAVAVAAAVLKKTLSV